jgi:glucose-1-phosphate thymidylyltransferase
MKGLILAAGLGTRLRPITSLSPKPIISVANRPLIYYAVDNLVEAGIRDIGIVVSPATRESIEVTLAPYTGATFTYIVQDPPLGLAHAVKVSQDFLGDDSFVMYLGDNLFEHGIKSFVDQFRAQNKLSALLALTEVEDPRAFGVAVVEGDEITQLIEKPQQPPSNLAVAGVYAFTKDIHAMIEGLKPGAKNEYQITDAIARLIESNHKVGAAKVEGWWKDTGKPEDILDANRLMLLKLKADNQGVVENSSLVGDVVIGAGALIKNSTIFGPVLIGKQTTVEDAFIGPNTTLGNHVKVINAELEYAVVGDYTEISSVKTRIQNSLIGEDVRITGRVGRPATHRLIIGDKSTLIVQGG